MSLSIASHYSHSKGLAFGPARPPALPRLSCLRGMCGISGMYRGGGRPVDPSLLLAMAGELRHRGPDGVGLYVDGAFGMANTRLAVVDLESGDQPLSDEAGRYWAMQNGEIYNHVELRSELEQIGHVFETSSDTEVIAH